MDLKTTLSSTFAAITFIILAGISVFKYDKMDMGAVFSLMWRTVPATIIMGVLGRMMGSILDKPKNLADSDYQTDVLKALKKLDKNMTMADLNAKLAPVEDLPNDIEIQIPQPNNGDKNEPTA